MLQDIREVLISKEAIEAKTKELAERISRDYKGKRFISSRGFKGVSNICFRINKKYNYTM